MNFKEMFSNSAEKINTKQFLTFVSFLILSLESFAGSGVEKKTMTKEDVKAVYAKYDQYAKTHQNDTFHTKLDGYDISMFSVGKGYEFNVVQNIDKTTTSAVDAGIKISTEHKAINYHFVDQDADGEANQVYSTSSTSTSSTTTNAKTPVNIKSPEVKSVLPPVFNGVVSVVDQALK